MEWAVSLISKDIEFLNEKNEKKLVGEIIFDFNDVEKFFRYFRLKLQKRLIKLKLILFMILMKIKFN